MHLLVGELDGWDTTPLYNAGPARGPAEGLPANSEGKNTTVP